jgi:AbiV family abortive infection protein
MMEGLRTCLPIGLRLHDMAPKQTSAQVKARLSADVLARGTAYAMEQAWTLLRDAVLLIQDKRYASSLVLATFCLEQLGRAEIYRENAKQAFAGKPVTLVSMGRALTDHLPKLVKARIPVTASLVSFGDPPAPGSEAAVQLAERLAAIREINEGQAPHKALDVRKRALHVDRIHDVPGWNRPSSVITKDDADYWVSAADVRYGLLRSELEKDNTDVGKKIWAGIEQLQLPESPWDIWTWQEETAEDRQALKKAIGK